MAKPPPNLEWPVIDPPGLAKALDGMRKMRNLSLEAMRNKVGSQSPPDVIRGSQKNLRSDMMLRVASFMDFEWLVRAVADPEVVWIFSDRDGMVAALNQMRLHSGLSVEDLARRAGCRAAVDMLRGYQANIRSDSLIRTVNALNFQLVVRQVTTTSRAQRRLALLKEASLRGKATQAQAVEGARVDPRRDERGRIRPEVLLTEQEKADADALLAQYGNYR